MVRLTCDKEGALFNQAGVTPAFGSKSKTQNMKSKLFLTEIYFRLFLDDILGYLLDKKTSFTIRRKASIETFKEFKKAIKNERI